MKTVRLILGDQLNQNHSWFNEVNDNVIYLMAEMRQETDYVKHHIQKVIAFFLAMRNFKDELSAKGHQFIYFSLTDANNPQQLEEIITKTIKESNAKKFEYQLPDEYRLDEQLNKLEDSLPIATSYADTEHFYTTRFELRDFFKGKKQMIMESFYRMMRKKHDILINNDQPEGGKWNYDQSNRNKWKGQPSIPHEKDFKKNVEEIIEELSKAKVKTFGKQLAMHVAASNPLGLDSDGISKDIIKKEEELVSEELKNTGKPEDIVKKISLGKMKKFKEDNSLLNQGWVMEPKKKVKDILKDLNIPDLKIKDFFRLKIGE